MVEEQLAEEGAAQGQHQLVCGEGLKVLGDDGEVGKLGLEVQILPGLTKRGGEGGAVKVHHGGGGSHS